MDFLKFVKNNASIIVAITAGVGVVTTAVMTTTATVKAVKIIEDVQKEKEEKLTKKEILDYTALLYVPPLIVAATTITAIFAGHILNKHIQQNMSASYTMLHNLYMAYQKKNIELNGIEAHNKVVEALEKEYEDILNHNDARCKEILLYISEADAYVCTTFDQIERNMQTFNQLIYTMGYISLKDLCHLFNIESVGSEDEEVGWSIVTMKDYCDTDWIGFDTTEIVEPYINDFFFGDTICYRLIIDIPPTVGYADGF